MKISHYIKRVEESKEFEKFKKKNPSAYLCAGFFVYDFETGNEMHQIDYAISNNKIATFNLDDGIKFKVSKQALKKEIPELKGKTKTDLDALKGIVEDEMKNRTVTDKIKKIIMVYHILDDKPIWNLQCITDGMGIISVHIDDTDQSILKFEKFSMMDMIKKLPSSMANMMPKPGQPGQPGQPVQGKQLQQPTTKLSGNDSQKLEALNKLQKMLEKEKKQAEKLDKKEKNSKKIKSKKK